MFNNFDGKRKIYVSKQSVDELCRVKEFAFIINLAKTTDTIASKQGLFDFKRFHIKTHHICRKWIENTFPMRL